MNIGNVTSNGLNVNYSKEEQNIKTGIGDIPKFLSSNDDYKDLTQRTTSVFDEQNSKYSDDYRDITTKYDDGSKLHLEIDKGQEGGYNDIFSVFRTSLKSLIDSKDVKRFSFFDAKSSKNPKYSGEFVNSYSERGDSSKFKSFKVDLDSDGIIDREYEYAGNDGGLTSVSYDTDDDGNLDYKAEYDMMHKMTSEEFDLDDDGRMDVIYEYYDDYYTKKDVKTGEVETFGDAPKENKTSFWNPFGRKK